MDTSLEDLRYKLALTHVPNVGSVIAKTLISYCGSARAVFHAKKSHLLKIPGVGETTASSIVDHNSIMQRVDQEISFIQKHKITPLFFLDKCYPIRLKRLRDAPVMLYYRGNADLNATQSLAIVGTRKPTLYGKIQCEKILEGLKGHDILVVSGLAYGVDITAHRKALHMDLPTVGVLGSGLDRIYPSTHRKIADEMISGSGGILSEFPSGTGPDREHFPMRNRIIAGLCDALLVVESGKRGGSMISAILANDYHKDVFAIPGRVGDPQSEGCNELIKSNRAQLLESGEELCEIMQWKEKESLEGLQQKMFQDLTPREKEICDILEGNSTVSIDRLYKSTTYTASEMAGVLLELEFKGVIKALPGKMYTLM